jgi:Phosphoserine phosphatase RsbU, N-terminal domain
VTPTAASPSATDSDQPMNAATASFQGAYTHAFRAFLSDDAEANLRAAYELGREAVGRSLGLLELAQVHHHALLAELRASVGTEDVDRVTLAGADFMVEALSAYEMVRRGFTESRDAVDSERRRARMLRQLSTLLADASLAMHAQSSVEEVLQLVAEQTRELTDAPWCIACAVSRSVGPSLTVAHTGAPQPALDELAREAFAAIATGTDHTRVVTVQMSSAPIALAAIPLTALDGELIGVLAAPDGERPFNALHEAVLLHIGQMTSAALERAERYHGHAANGRCR